MRKPRRAPAKYLDGAPPYVLSVRDAGPTHNDRYTVVFGWPIWQPSMGRTLPYLGFNNCPGHPAAGISMWGEGPAAVGGSCQPPTPKKLRSFSGRTGITGRKSSRRLPPPPSAPGSTNFPTHTPTRNYR